MPYTQKTDAELRQLAEDIVEHRVFGSWNLEHDEIQMVFMPLGLMDQASLDELRKNDVCHVYESLDKAGPRSVNGLPMFLSFQCLLKKDQKKVVELIDQYKALKEKFRNQPVSTETGPS